MASIMEDQKSDSKLLAAGETTIGSSTHLSILQRMPVSTHASVKHQGNEAPESHALVGRPGTPASETIVTDFEEHQSPVLSTHFSEAPTLFTTDSRYTANTGGRARHSWRGGTAHFSRDASMFSSKNPLDSSLINDDNAAPSFTDDSQCIALRHGLAAAPVASPDEPCSFFDSDSESEGETIIRVASRANSLRGRRPKLIDHHLSDGSLSRTRFYQSSLLAPPRDAGPSQTKAEQVLGVQLKNLLDLTPARERSDPLALRNGGTTAPFNSLTTSEVGRASTRALSPSPPQSPSVSSDPSLVLEAQHAPLTTQALNNLSSPLGGFGTVNVLQPNSPHFGVSPLDALRSNPVTRLDTIRLNRSTSAPPVPQRRNRNVRIRPVDTEVIHTVHQKKRFRESVVSTPYPTRQRSFDIADHLQTPTGTAKATNLPPPAAEKNVTQSPSVYPILPSEVLILELSLANHPLRTKTLTIPIHDRTIFDDRALFTLVRKAYNHSLLGFSVRFLAARTLLTATFTLPSSPTSTVHDSTGFDAADFVKHLKRAKSGHKRKTWLRWLRKHQPRYDASSEASGLNSPSESNASGFFSPEGTPPVPALFGPQPPQTPVSGLSSRYNHHHRNAHHHHHHHHQPSDTSHFPTAPPRIVLHHTFSLPSIATAVLVVLTLTVLAAVLWVLFGTPGPGVIGGGADSARYGNWSTSEAGIAIGDWRSAAQNRVLTACVLAILVFLMGASTVMVWVAGSWAIL